jgi:hypothetical protein
MIQRKQSIYLTFVLLLCIIFCRGAVFSFTDGTGTEVKLLLSGLLTDHSGTTVGQVANNWLLTAILIISALLSVVTIFLYKNRKIQLILAKSVIAGASILIIALSWYGYNAITTFKLTIIPGLKMAVPAMILLFAILAFRSILSDDRLVKSYDRLR